MWSFQMRTLIPTTRLKQGQLSVAWPHAQQDVPTYSAKQQCDLATAVWPPIVQNKQVTQPVQQALNAMWHQLIIPCRRQNNLHFGWKHSQLNVHTCQGSANWLMFLMFFSSPQCCHQTKNRNKDLQLFQGAPLERPNPCRALLGIPTRNLQIGCELIAVRLVHLWLQKQSFIPTPHLGATATRWFLTVMTVDSNWINC